MVPRPVHFWTAGFARLWASAGRRSQDRKMANPFQFLQDVRSEAAKVTWPTRKETLVTTGGVFVMVVVASAFFFLADVIVRNIVGLVLGIGR